MFFRQAVLIQPPVQALWLTMRSGPGSEVPTFNFSLNILSLYIPAYHHTTRQVLWKSPRHQMPSGGAGQYDTQTEYGIDIFY